MKTKPFNLELARAGAAVATTDGQAVDMLRWDLSGRKPLLGLVGEFQSVVRWHAGGTFTLYRPDPLDLVMVG